MHAERAALAAIAVCLCLFNLLNFTGSKQQVLLQSSQSAPTLHEEPLLTYERSRDDGSNSTQLNASDAVGISSGYDIQKKYQPETPLGAGQAVEEDPVGSKGLEPTSTLEVETRTTTTLTPMRTTETLPKPIFVLSLPKSGTTSSARYFNCGKVKASHHWAKWGSGKKDIHRTGDCMLRNVEVGQELLEGCGNYDAWSDAGVPGAQKNPPANNCFYPSINGLDNIATHYSNATIVLAVRNATSWLVSAKKQSGGRLFKKWQRFCPDFPNKEATDQDWIDFYNWHTDNLRAFTKKHPSLTYIEFSLEDKNVGEFLHGQTGVSADCWECRQPTGGACAPKFRQMRRWLREPFPPDWTPPDSEY